MVLYRGGKRKGIIGIGMDMQNTRTDSWKNITRYGYLADIEIKEAVGKNDSRSIS